MRVRSLGQEDPLEKGMATHSSILAWRIPWTEECGGLQSIGCVSQSQTRLKQPGMRATGRLLLYQRRGKVIPQKFLPWNSFFSLFLPFTFLWISLKIFNHLFQTMNSLPFLSIFPTDWKTLINLGWFFSFLHLSEFMGGDHETLICLFFFFCFVLFCFQCSLPPGRTENWLTTTKHYKNLLLFVVWNRRVFSPCFKATNIIECNDLKPTPRLTSKKCFCQTTMSMRDECSQ